MLSAERKCGGLALSVRRHNENRRCVARAGAAEDIEVVRRRVGRASGCPPRCYIRGRNSLIRLAPRKTGLAGTPRLDVPVLISSTPCGESF